MKTREQRTKELTTPSAVRAAWGAINAKYKDFNAPIYLKIGNIAGRAKDYDDGTTLFLDTVKKKQDDTKKFLDDTLKQYDTQGKKIEDLKKEIDSTRDYMRAGKKLSGGAEPEDMLERIDELAKGTDDLISERQSIFDNLMKAYQAMEKLLSDARDKMEKTIDTANATLDKANKDIDAAELDIRKYVRGYYQNALDNGKKDMADAVNKLLGEFGK